MIKMSEWFVLILAAALAACSQPQGPGPVPKSPAPVSLPTGKDTVSGTDVAIAPSTATATGDEDLDYQETPVDPKDMLGPTESIKNLDQRVEKYHLGQSLTPEQAEENRRLKKEIIQGTFDIKELCRLALGKHWDEISEQQRRHFVKLMISLLEKKAIFSKEQLKGESKYYRIQYLKETFDDAEKTRSTVTSKMFIPKDKIDLDLTYKVKASPYGWKIYDVIVDDASLLLNYKNQFHNIIEKSGFGELVNRMETKLKEIK